MDAEVIVVGAGPGGASAAYWLARYGRRVLLLDRRAFPRDKSCGDGVTRSAARLLADMGVLSRLGKAQRIRGVRVFMRGKGFRDFEYPGDLSPPNCGLVVPRLTLDHVICQQATAEGAELLMALVTGLVRDDGAVVGVDAVHQGEPVRLRAPVVVVAAGAASRLPYQLMATTPSEEGRGFAIRCYVHGLTGLTDLLEIYMPLTDPAGRRLLPSYGWVFPTGPSSANVGVGLFGQERDVNVRELMGRFLRGLRLEDPRFAGAAQHDPWRAAPLRFDFEPERCAAPGVLLVGDAAGMVSPFTGEGISYAIESGKLAAEVIHDALRPGSDVAPDLSAYSRRLGRRHTGYFETGRRSARRYLLVWRVLESTFHNERPLFALCRQAVLFPEGVGESYVGKLLDDVGPLLGGDAGRLRSDLLAIGEVLLDAIRKDWPFLARMSAVDLGAPDVPFRPALLMLLSSYLARPRQPQTTLLGAAIELGYLAALANLSVEEEPAGPAPPGGDAANWGNMFALMVGDFLLSQANELSARVSADVSRLIGESLATACEGRVRELRTAHDLSPTQAERLEILAQKTATLFELPCRLGALLGGASATDAAALASYGRNLGLAFQLAEDAAGAAGRMTRFGTTLEADLRAGIYSIPVLHALRRGGNASARLRAVLGRVPLTAKDARTAARLVAECDGEAAARSEAAMYATRARAALDHLQSGPTRHALKRLTEYAANRAVVAPTAT